MYGKGLISSEWLSDNRSYKNEVVVAEIMKWRALESVIWGDRRRRAKANWERHWGAKLSAQTSRGRCANITALTGRGSAVRARGEGACAIVVQREGKGSQKGNKKQATASGEWVKL